MSRARLLITRTHIHLAFVLRGEILLYTSKGVKHYSLDTRQHRVSVMGCMGAPKGVMHYSLGASDHTTSRYSRIVSVKSAGNYIYRHILAPLVGIPVGIHGPHSARDRHARAPGHPSRLILWPPAFLLQIANCCFNIFKIILYLKLLRPRIVLSESTCLTPLHIGCVLEAE